MALTEKELQIFTHKLRNMFSFNKEDIEEIKKMNLQELIILIIVLNDMYDFCLKIIENEVWNES